MYTPLHNHDEYSVLDGFSHPVEYLDRVIELGLDSFAITNHGNQMSWIYYDQLLQQDKYKHLKMIYGVEVYECFNMYEKDKNNKYFHLVLLARTERGRNILNKVVTTSNLKGFYYKPRIDLSTLRELKPGKDVIALSACLASKLSREEDYNKCIEYIREYKKVFPYFFLEMQSHSSEDQALYNQKLLQFSKELRVPYIITTDSHAATKNDLKYQGRHVQIAQDKETMSESYEGCYVQSVNEIHAIMDKQVGKRVVDKGLENTLKIRDLIEDVKMPFQTPQLPSFKLPEGFNNDTEYLRYLAEEGWKIRNIDSMTDKEVETRKERLEYELSVIAEMGFDGYFIIVWDFINWAKKAGIMVGAGRGSGAGSFVCFLLNITDLDPVKYDLIFQRFLNPERVSMPDLDIDFSDREPVVKYLIEKYGLEKVCQVINFNFISPLNAIKDSFRVCGFPYTVADAIAKKFTYPTFKECVDHNEFLLDSFPEYKEAFDIAAKISGRVRGIGIHAGGVGIVDTDINDYMGMVKGGKDEQVIQVDKKLIEDIGIIKFDLLGVKTLQLVQDVLSATGLSEWDINVNNPKFTTDEAAFDLLCKANTNAIFQVESQGMKDLLLRLQPRNLEELSAVIALYRPDSMGALEEFIENKHDKTKVKYIHPDMKPILENTFGCMLYQEQLLDIVRTFGGRSYGQADLFRKAIGKKNEKLIMEESTKLYHEIVANGYSKEIASTISSFMGEKGGYCFNKSHSFSYAVLCLQTAYLKAHYPLEFYTALFNLKTDNGVLNKYINDALNNGIEVLPPSINKSQKDFSICDGKILFGLSHMAGIGEAKISPIIEEREANGKFKSLADILERTLISESEFVLLVKSGAIPCKSKKDILIKYAENKFSNNSEFKPLKTLPNLLKLNEYGINTSEIKSKAERLRLYNIVKEEEFYDKLGERKLKLIDDFTKKYMCDEIMWEFQALSIFLTHNPFEETSKYIRNYEEVSSGQEVVIVGVVSQTILKKNKNKQQYAFMNVCTAFGLVQIACWASQYKNYMLDIKKGNNLAILCKKTESGYSVVKIKDYSLWRDDIGFN